jgi:hypothetical protein
MSWTVFTLLYDVKEGNMCQVIFSVDIKPQEWEVLSIIRYRGTSKIAGQL